MGKIRQDIEVERGKASRELKAYARDLERVFKDAEKSSTQSSSKIERGWNRSLGKIKVWIATTFSAVAVVGFTRALLRLNGSLEQTMTSFRVLTGSQEKANQLFKELETFAAKTPFQFPSLAKGAQQLLAFGFAAEDVIDILKDVGDAAAASPDGMEMGLTRIIRAFGQIRARGRLMGQEILQLTEAGIPVLEILADKFSTTTAEVSRLVEKGLVPANTAIEALREGLGERFGGLLGAQSQTFVGLTTTLRDLAEINLREIGKGLFTEVKGDLKAVVDELDRMGDSGEAARIGERIGRALRQIYTSARDIALLVVEYGPLVARLIGVILTLRVSNAIARGVTKLVVAIRGLGTAAAIAGTAMTRLSALLVGAPYLAFAAILGTVALNFGLLRKEAEDTIVTLDDLNKKVNQFKELGLAGATLGLAESEREYKELRERRQAIRDDDRFFGIAPDGDEIGRITARMKELQVLIAAYRTAKRELEAESKAASGGGKDEDQDARPLSTTSAEELRLERLALTARKEEARIINEIAGIERRIASLRRESAEKQMDPAALRELTQLIEALSSKQGALQDQLELLQSLPESAEAFVEILGGLEALVADPKLVESLKNAAPLFEKIASTTSDFRGKTLALQVQIDATSDPAAKAELERQLEELAAEFKTFIERDILAAVNSLDLPPAVKEELFAKIAQNLSGISKNAEDAAVSLEQVGRVTRSVYELGKALGLVSDNLGAIGEGAVSVFDGFANLSKTRDDLRDLGIALNSIQGITAQIPGFAQIGIGIARWIGELRNPSKESAQQERMRVTMERLADEFERSSKDIVAALDRFTESRIGEDTPGSQTAASLALVDALLTALDDLINGEGSSDRLRGAELMNEIRELVTQLEDSGLDLFDGLMNIFNIGGPDALLSGSGDFPGLQELRDSLAAQGLFSETVRGLIDDLQLFQDFISDDANAAFQRFIQNILGLDSVSEELQGRLQDLAALDPTTEAGQQAIRDILAQIASDSISGDGDTRSSLLGGLTPSELEEILSVIAGLAEGGGSSGADVTAQTTFSRSITEVQSNSVINWLQEIAHWTRETTLATRDLRNFIVIPVGDTAGTRLPGRPVETGVTVTVGDVNIGGLTDTSQIVQQAGKAFMRQLEIEIRRSERRGF